MDIVFIADEHFYKNSNGKTSYNFINYISKNKYYTITIFYTDEKVNNVISKINDIKPKLIIIFEINAFQEKTCKFNDIFNLNIPVYLFLDDTYYVTSITSKCQYTQLITGFIFWYNNELITKSYKIKFPDKQVLNFNSRYINTDIYKDYGLQKKYDILLYGNRNFKYNYKNEEIITIQNWIKKYEENNNIIINKKIDFYPLRVKLETILKKIQNRYNILILPEGTYDNSKIVNEELSKLINESYLTIACSSIADVLLHKHLEIPASKSVILGSYPSDYKELFNGNIIEVNEYMTDDQIINIIDNALSNKEDLELKSSRLYEKIKNQHNLNMSIESFNNIVTKIF